MLPTKLTPALVKPVTGLLNVTVKLTGPALTGLPWPAASETVTAKPAAGLGIRFRTRMGRLYSSSRLSR